MGPVYYITACPLPGSGIIVEGEVRGFSEPEVDDTRKQSLPDTAGRLLLWIWGGYSSMCKTCSGPSLNCSM